MSRRPWVVRPLTYSVALAVVLTGGLGLTASFQVETVPETPDAPVAAPATVPETPDTPVAAPATEPETADTAPLAPATVPETADIEPVTPSPGDETLPVEVAPAPAAVGACPTGQCQTKTVLVPEYVTEMRCIKAVVNKPRVRTECITVWCRVPQTHTTKQVCTVCVPETRTKLVPCICSTPVYKKTSGEQTCPKFEKIPVDTCYETCEFVDVTVMRKVYEDMGHWAVRCTPQLCETKCTVCGKAEGNSCACKVWVPNLVCNTLPFVEKQLKNVQKIGPVDQIVEKQETTKWQRFDVVGYEQDLTSCQVPYTVYVPQKQVRTHTTTTYSCIPMETTKQTIEMVPCTIEKMVPVSVCRMVPKTICVSQCPACASAECE